MTAKLIAILDASCQAAEVVFVKREVHAEAASVIDSPVVSHGALPAKSRMGTLL
jgi:hypothetical protein